MRSAKARAISRTRMRCACMSCGFVPAAAGPGGCCAGWGCYRRRRGRWRTDERSIVVVVVAVLLARFDFAHLLDPRRELAQVALRGTFVRGLALARGKSLVRVIAARRPLRATLGQCALALDGQVHPLVV